jgi:membrane-bound ClpP family serine protease
LNRKFWNWVRNEDSRTLYLDGAIAEETWYGDEVTPKLFKSELMNGSGDITIWINSPGGDVFAASQIYNMLMDYPGKVTVKIDGIAASAASVIAMAGGEVLMSPVSMIMIHNPMTIAFGDTVEMERAIAMLSEPSLTAGEPDTILNRPIKTSSHVPTIAASAKVIAFGDFSHYWVADRQGRSFQRLNELYAANGQVGFRATQPLRPQR